jgi:hypothetical protein
MPLCPQVVYLYPGKQSLMQKFFNTSGYCDVNSHSFFFNP